MIDGLILRSSLKRKVKINNLIGGYNMASIELEELKKILPDIFNAWMDGDDESWEWIFQEIEQKCHVGKKKKGKKQKKHIERVDELTKKVDDIIPKIMGDFDARINAQTKRVDGLSNKISNLSDKYTTMVTKVNRMYQDVGAAKSMAKTAKDRTQVDYSKYSGKSDGNINYNKEKSDADVIQEVYNRMSGRGATFEELENFRNVIKKYDALEKKEIPVTKKMCETCKYFSESMNSGTCERCNLNDKWEAKDND